MKAVVFLTVLVFLLSSCIESKKKDTVREIIEEWTNKEILLPQNATFHLIDKSMSQIDTLSYQYKVFVYYNSFDCVSCNLKFTEWTQFASEIDSISPSSVMFQFVFHPRRLNELKLLLKRENFNFPFYLDENGDFEKLNHFPKDLTFRTFLLNKNNQIIAIGNPVRNPRVKELYLRIIKGEAPSVDAKQAKPMTTVTIDQASIDMGTFSWRKEQTDTFTLTNTGNKPLVIEAVNTSCGCITVEYPKEPVRPGSHATLLVIYQADQPEHFLKTITVYCNAEESPIKLKVSGNAI